MVEPTLIPSPELDFDTPALQRYRKRRAFKDKAASVSVAVGGMSVIVAVSLIFFYLLYEVIPLFKSASIEEVTSYPLPGEAQQTWWLAMEEQGEIGMRLTEDSVVFFAVDDGVVIKQERLPVPRGVRISSINQGSVGNEQLVAGLSDGTALLIEHQYKSSYESQPDGELVRTIAPTVSYPGLEAPVELETAGAALLHVAARSSDDGIVLIGANANNELFGKSFELEENFLTGESSLAEIELALPEINGAIQQLLLSPDRRWLYVLLEDGALQMFDIRKSEAKLVSQVDLSADGAAVTKLQFLLGDFALLVSDSAGNVSQWFPVRDDKNKYSLQKVRSFEAGTGNVTALSAEHRRKGFVTGDENGRIAFFNTTAETRLLAEKVIDSPVLRLAISPRANRLALVDGRDQLHLYLVDNEHPDVSFSALWSEVWYEGYDEPEYIWQSSAANTDFEPKYSLMPLTFGTLKGAFYAMLLAVPLAICGAIYTAHFMAPAVRKKVKPSIELMEALPTVILGFLAGLFFAPFMEENLPGVFAVLVITPLGILLFGFIWANMPDRVRHLVPDGYDPLLLIPVILLIGWLSFAVSPYLELWFFGGNMRDYLTSELGIDYDQRNALVVGAAMGFAIIPTIFSITEDAIFSVPKHLNYGSLALGATQWQTMVRVILPTASPGIFSAVMIGLGRAVGETMIVLMATGNTPIMDVNIFEGMRTLSANIAVEMPETEVASSHYRILFLTALVLFVFTFVLNTLAEFVRQRLRNKYSVI
ncbi:ABC transporter permease subunit [Allohahella sp. A8]|uniref:ABC transporter permease subunit n=1 Tax=Allohahella sp. A8 TaxID=3141461 RepID=UPI000C0A0C5D|nr:phosphate ABC transporter permease [Hahellaceae bacterium]|tara:strand:- start:17079 stop:19364 length:2286 start_codon:yes stop_codon:yes gene_type:complete